MIPAPVEAAKSTKSVAGKTNKKKNTVKNPMDDILKACGK